MSWATLSVPHVSDAVCLSCLEMGSVNKFLNSRCTNQYALGVKVYTDLSVLMGGGGGRGGGDV